MRVSHDDWFMTGAGIRIRRTIAEKRRIVELTLEPGASVARVAQAEGVNANQVFAWRRSYSADTLADILEYLPEVADRKEEDATRWKEKPTVALFASALTL